LGWINRYDEKVQPRSNDIFPYPGSSDSGADDLSIFLYFLTKRQFLNFNRYFIKCGPIFSIDAGVNTATLEDFGVSALRKDQLDG